MAKDNRAGFTLIELIIVIFIILLFSGMSLAYFGTYNNDKKLGEELKKLTTILYLARNKASAGDADPSVCTDFKGYRLNIQDAHTYSLDRNCGGVYTAIQTSTTIDPLIIDTPPSGFYPYYILFKPLNTGTDLTVTTNIVIKNPNSSQCIGAQITPLGVIVEGDIFSC